MVRWRVALKLSHACVPVRASRAMIDASPVLTARMKWSSSMAKMSSSPAISSTFLPPSVRMRTECSQPVNCAVTSFAYTFSETPPPPPFVEQLDHRFAMALFAKRMFRTIASSMSY